MEIITQPWALRKEDAIEKLGSTPSGITDKEAAARISKFGQNAFRGKEKPSFFGLFLKQFLSPLIFLLIGAAVLTSTLHEGINTVLIVFAILVNIGLGFYHEYHAENTLDKLSSYIKDRARVIREGKEEEIDSLFLVPGDMIKLSYGARVPADARLVTSNNFYVDEAIITGESTPVGKSEREVSLGALVAERSSVAHAGSLVVEGYANAIVYATGNNTEIGKIAGIVSTTKRTKTPLQRGVERLAWTIFFAVFLLSASIFILGILRGESLLPMLVLSAAVAVGGVPESLPIALTVILAIGSERIANKKGIVRKLTAAETLGSTTLIMTDKTGTLTMADMQLVDIHPTSALLSGSSKIGEDNTLSRSFSADQKELLLLALHNIDVSIENRGEEESKWNFRGRPFEVNIAKACRDHGVSLDTISSLVSYLVLPFNSTNKFSVAERDGNYLCMGAPDVLLGISNIGKEDYIRIESWINKISREGKRIIGIGRRRKEGSKNFSISDVKDLDFVGVLVFYDPIRKEVPNAIRNIESHGIKMVLVTGDLKGTALSVVKSLDWKVGEHEVLVGSDIQKMSDKELLSVISGIKIFARVTPEDKLRIGRLYQEQGEIVAMTGDGVNDAPALKAMDIGVALGSGSDVAKSAADLVLLDDNFETISLAIDEGRKILSNIRKTFTYLLSNSFDELCMVGGSLIFALPIPLTALQIIWVNLFSGTLPALAFAFDENMDKEKVERSETKSHIIFTKSVKFLIFGAGLVSSLMLFVLYYVLVKIGINLMIARSILFVCFASYVLAIAFSFRSLHHPLWSYSAFSNPKLNASIIIASIFLIVTMAVPSIRDIFGLHALPWAWVPFVVFWLVINILLIEAAKYTVRKWHL